MNALLELAAGLLAALFMVKRASASVQPAPPSTGAQPSQSSEYVYYDDNQYATFDNSGGDLLEPAQVFAPPTMIDPAYWGDAGMTTIQHDYGFSQSGSEPITIDQADNNVRAFLNMIRFAEGTDGPDGYNTIFGYAKFTDFSDHPRRIIRSGGYSSDAAGAYQIMSYTWDDIRGPAGLSDFSPASQDAAALFLLNRRGALEDVKAGRFQAALQKAAQEWASLPGSPYGQPMRSYTQVAQVFETNGGLIAMG